MTSPLLMRKHTTKRGYRMSNRRTFLLQTGGLISASFFAHETWAQPSFGNTLERVQKTKILRIGAVRGGTPYYYKNIVSNQWEGCMIDMASDLAKSLGATTQINETTWGNAVLDLQAGKIDVFFGLFPTEQRREAVAFSDPLFHNANSLVARPGFNPTTWESLNKKGVRIAVDLGSSYDALVTKTCPEATIMRFDKTNDATLAVQAGRADCQVTVIILALTMLKKNPSMGHLIVPLPMASTTTNAALPKEESDAWQGYFNKWLAGMHQSGKIKQIMLSNLEKLVGVKPSDIPSQVNF
ncbi:transporter substrate-binding domain-containing protein [Robbsia andropogonis]|uniref:transporter substrate-binding domain-containing protein n=1 Tax=Robbsia andropogonis TaxID=28092 RepID=UPI001FC7C331|nr:transporter substrate-binding domain-containing protein [Robbsia andropogonis]MCP1119534.1 transporter substrate-binding domain-containing protein [Robbsia andropogonis]MCP1129517.1 transporter substrate-binding domain-containing protein [Robbsia andropogonis]